jgi:hypothetical protein
MALVLVLHNYIIIIIIIISISISIIIIIIIIIGLMSCYMQWLRAGDSLVGIAIRYGLDGPGIEFR